MPSSAPSEHACSRYAQWQLAGLPIPAGGGLYCLSPQLSNLVLARLNLNNQSQLQQMGEGRVYLIQHLILPGGLVIGPRSH